MELGEKQPCHQRCGAFRQGDLPGLAGWGLLAIHHSSQSQRKFWAKLQLLA